MVENDRDVIDEGRTHTLALVEGGWGIWDRADRSGEPLALYPPDDDGFELALEHFRRVSRSARIGARPWLDILQRVAVVAGVLWIVSSAVARLVFAIQWPRSPTGFDSLSAWSQALEGTAYPVFVVSVGMYVVLWLRGR